MPKPSSVQQVGDALPVPTACSEGKGHCMLEPIAGPIQPLLPPESLDYVLSKFLCAFNHGIPPLVFASRCRKSRLMAQPQAGEPSPSGLNAVSPRALLATRNGCGIGSLAYRAPCRLR